MAERYNENIKYILTEKTKQIEFKIKQDIWESLPELRDEELDLFNSIESNIGHLKDSKRKFYDKIKKSYLNYYELSFVNEDFLYELYYFKFLSDHLIGKSQSNSKDYFINEISKKSEDIRNHITSYFSSQEENFSIGESDLMSSIIIDDTFVSNANIRKVYFYHNKIASSQILEIPIDSLYFNIFEDLFFILNNRPNLHHLVIKFNSKSYLNKLFEKNEICEDYENKANDVIYVILKYINENLIRDIYSITIKTNSDNNNNCLFKLRDDNNDLLDKIILSNHILILHLENIILNKKIVESFKSNLSIEILILNSILANNKDMLSKVKETNKTLKLLILEDSIII